MPMLQNLSICVKLLTEIDKFLIINTYKHGGAFNMMLEALALIVVVSGAYFFLKAIWNYELKVARQK